jgi:hypothetical protein
MSILATLSLYYLWFVEVPCLPHLQVLLYLRAGDSMLCRPHTLKNLISGKDSAQIRGPYRAFEINMLFDRGEAINYSLWIKTVETRGSES